ncbi:hypothetical protein [Brevifollis gellanilyticus]|uniref:DUF4064 domain-containing protein n=1 Tax=Brevifollis gellanilyticus TaxID=748831 RepID=A0A512MI27_9BACT|nr:hypothetical protein [Brevifollis gellanilyticus]GEP46396.1 hypothetical protein BGE01nite_56870 [Brevifollis gellanilyticus]
MNLRTCAAIASLLLLAAPLAMAGWGAYGMLTFTSKAVLIPGGKEVFMESFQTYFGAIFIGFLGFILAGICLDGLGMRDRWYLRSLTALGILWLFYIPAGTLFGIGLLVYLAFKQRAQRRLTS